MFAILAALGVSMTINGFVGAHRREPIKTTLINIFASFLLLMALYAIVHIYFV